MTITSDSSESVVPCTFGMIVGQIKNFCSESFLNELKGDLLIVDARARARTNEFVVAGQRSRATTAVDPVTYFARSSVGAQPAQFKELPYAGSGGFGGFSDQGSRQSWCRQVLTYQLAHNPDVVIAPYFYAAHRK